MKHIFEISWEVCNKVGGIHTVISSKAQTAIDEYGQGYVCFGPDLGQDAEFEEIDDGFWSKLKPALERENLQCRFGRWRIPGSPKVILVGGFKERYNIERLLYKYWEEFGVDSYDANWDYVEPILFSTACAEVIEQISESMFTESDSAMAHFHEWMCGAGLLYLKKNVPSIGTIFSTHATILGRSMAHHNDKYYHEMNNIRNLDNKAHIYGVANKHSMESITAQQADCFTTVSEITGGEAYILLGKRPDLIAYNGMNVGPEAELDKKSYNSTRSKLLKTCSDFLGEQLPDETLIWIASGRYEFKNKGYDISLEAAAKLKEQLGKDAPPILLLFLIAADNNKVEANYQWPQSKDPDFHEVAISPVWNKDHDPIINSAKHFGLDRKDSKVKTILSTLYLDGHDGIFNTRYEDLLKVADITLFPSFYEPWGYTPMESALEGVPTITSDLAGFGYWTQMHEVEWEPLVKLLARKNKNHEETIAKLTELMLASTKIDRSKLKSLTNKLREELNWKAIFEKYQQAYTIAAGKSFDRSISGKNKHEQNPFSGAMCHIQPGKPQLRCFALETNLPLKLEKLNDLAQNLWWTWNDTAQDLFRSINPELWDYYDRNPIKLLKNIHAEDTELLKQNPEFLQKLDEVYQEFLDYMDDTSISSLIDMSRPAVAYMSMEFGIHESLPIYSGGLGILAGDHLKAASDADLNLFGVGLFYQQGYFVQEINHDGQQVEHFNQQRWHDLPLSLLLNHAGETVKIPVKFPDRTVWARVLVARVGKVPLFLLDTDFEDNNSEDRKITSQLYVADRETRIQQEFLIGVAGVILLKDILGLDPAVYHLNEGHCAFMTAELLRRYSLHGYSFESAIQTIKTNTVFTTHTPVPAGNEAFAVELVHRMFSHFFNNMKVPVEKFIELGLHPNNPDEFSMTVLALRVSSKANAVSKLHGQVSEDMWKEVMPKNKNFFSYVTNGVHMPTWQARAIRELDLNRNPATPLTAIWNGHQVHKRELIQHLNEHIKSEYLRRGFGIEEILKILDGLDENNFLIGFARRFAPYKRADLIFKDLERLKKLLSQADKPVTLIFAGKSHPADGRGKEIIQEIYRHVQAPGFIGKILLIEDYDMQIGRLLTSGVDLWLNNPIWGKEACGTSGMKAAASGVPNFSIADGWWYEGYKAEIGWELPRSTAIDYELMCKEESQILYQILERQIVPMYYDRNSEGVPKAWVEIMKNSILDVSQNFSAKRMIEDYIARFYQREESLILSS